MDENNFDNFSVPGTNSSDGFNDAVNTANDAVNNAADAGNSVLDNVADAVDAVGNAADSVADTVADAISGAVNGASDAFNGNVNTGADNSFNGNVNTNANNNFSQPAIQPDAVYTSGGEFVSPAPQQEGSKVLAIVSMILGIISVITCCCYGGGLPFGIAAIITGIISKKKNQPGGGMALAGIITGAVGTLMGVIGLIMIIIGIISGSGTPSYSSYLN